MIRQHRQSIFVLLTALLYLPSYAIAVGPPTILTFDDIVVPANSQVAMPVGYGSVNWPNNMGIWALPQTPYIAQSPPNRVLFNYNGGGALESLVTFVGGPKIFHGAYFSGYDTVHFKLYNGATLVSTSSSLILGSSGSGPTFLASGYAGPVDTVGIVGTPAHIAMDDFKFEQIPEPSTFLLLGIGAISLLGYRKAKTRG